MTGLDWGRPEAESVQAYVDQRLPHAQVVVDEQDSQGVTVFGLRLQIGNRGRLDDALMYRDPSGAVPAFVGKMVRDLESLGMETFKVAIAERTAQLEADLSRERDRSSRAEAALADAQRTIRALVGKAGAS